MAIKRINPSRNAWDNQNRQSYGYVIRVPKLPDAHKFVVDFIVFNESDNCFYKCVEVNNNTQHYYMWRAVTFGASRAYLIPVGKLTTTDINDATESWTSKGFVGCIPKTLNEIVFGMRRYRGTIHYPIGYAIATGIYGADHTYYRWEWNDTIDGIEMVLRKRFTGEMKQLTAGVDYNVGDVIEDEVYTLTLSTDPVTHEPNWGDITMSDMADKANELIERLNQHEADIPLADKDKTVDDLCKVINLMIEEVNPFCVPWQLLLNRQNFLESEVGQVQLDTNPDRITPEIQMLRTNLAKWAEVQWECFYFTTSDTVYKANKTYYTREIISGGVVPHNYTYVKVVNPTIGAAIPEPTKTFEKYDLPTELLYGTVVQAIDAALNLIRYNDFVIGRTQDLDEFPDPAVENDTLVKWLNRLKLKVDQFYQSIEECKISLKQIHDSIGDVGFARTRDTHFQQLTPSEEWPGYYYWDTTKTLFTLVRQDDPQKGYSIGGSIAEWEEAHGLTLYQFYNEDVARTLIAKNAADILINKQDVDNLLGTKLKRIYVEKLDEGSAGQVYYYFDRTVSEYDHPFIPFTWGEVEGSTDEWKLKDYQAYFKSPIFVHCERNEYIVSNETATRTSETYYYKYTKVDTATATVSTATTYYTKNDDLNMYYAFTTADRSAWFNGSGSVEDPYTFKTNFQVTIEIDGINRVFKGYYTGSDDYVDLNLPTGTALASYRAAHGTIYVKKQTAAIQIRVNNEEIHRIGFTLFNYKIEVDAKIEEQAKRTKRLKQLTGVNGNDDIVAEWVVDGYLELTQPGQYREYRKYYKLDPESVDPLRLIEMISGTEEEYAQGYKYILTVDEIFRAGVNYYTRTGSTTATYVYELATVEPGTAVKPKTYYNQIGVDYVVPYYALTTDVQFQAGKTYYRVNSDGKFAPQIVSVGNLVDEGIWYEFHNITPRPASGVYIRKARKEHGGYEENNTHRGLIDRNTRDIEDHRQECGLFQKWTKQQIQAIEDFIFNLMLSTLDVITQERSTLSLLHETIGKLITLHNALERLQGNQTWKPADGRYDSGYDYYMRGTKERISDIIIIEPVTDVIFSVTSDTVAISGKTYYNQCDVTYTLTRDTIFIEGKTYYTRTGDGTTADPYKYHVATVVIGEDVPRRTYYEVAKAYYTEADVSTGMQYFITADSKFVSGKDYYTRSGSGVPTDPYVYTKATVVVGEDIPTDVTYYEYRVLYQMDTTGGEATGVIKRWVGSGFFLTKDTSLAVGKTYYTRTGGGTTRNPYIYSEYIPTVAVTPVPADTYFEWYEEYLMEAGVNYEIGLEVSQNVYTKDLVIATTENYTIDEIRMAVNRTLNYHIESKELPTYTELPDTDIILESMKYYRYVDDEWQEIIPETDDPEMIGKRIKDYDPMNKWFIKTGVPVPDGSDETKRYTETPIRMFLNELVKLHRRTKSANNPIDLANQLVLGLSAMPTSSTYGTLPTILSRR